MQLNRNKAIAFCFGNNTIYIDQYDNLYNNKEFIKDYFYIIYKNRYAITD